MSRPPPTPTSLKPSAWAFGGTGGCQLQARLVSEARVPSWGGHLESVSLCRQVAPLGWGGAPVSTMGRRLGVQRQVIVLLEKALPPARLRMLPGRLEGSSAKAERIPWRLQVLRQVLDPVWPPPSSGDSHWRPQSTSNVTQQVTEIMPGPTSIQVPPLPFAASVRSPHSAQRTGRGALQLRACHASHRYSFITSVTTTAKPRPPSRPHWLQPDSPLGALEDT